MTIKAILNYRNHPSNVSFRNQCKNRAGLVLLKLTKEKVDHLILIQDVNKVCQSSDIPLKGIQENIDIFSGFLCANFSSSIKSTKFPKTFTLADITPLHKKKKKDIKCKLTFLPNFS